jgi:hypothetical protein
MQVAVLARGDTLPPGALLSRGEPPNPRGPDPMGPEPPDAPTAR